MIWFTADTHFHHTNIIRYCNRPFDNVDDMDETLITNWNENIEPDDEVFHLGDFAFVSFTPDKAVEQLNDLIGVLNGKITLIAGSHDPKMAVLRQAGFEGIHKLYTLRWDHRKLILCHYPMREWESSYHGSWHLHGHSHGLQEPYRNSLDVGVDSHVGRPVSIKDVEGIMEIKKLELTKHEREVADHEQSA